MNIEVNIEKEDKDKTIEIGHIEEIDKYYTEKKEDRIQDRIDNIIRKNKVNLDRKANKIVIKIQQIMIIN